MEAAYMTVQELAQYLGVSRRTAYNLLDSGEVPSVKIGGSRRIPKAQLEAKLAAKTTGGWKQRPL